MKLESMARGAVLDIHRAVEVMEMSTSTDERPGTVERFDRYRDRKQRNRRIGAIAVAAVLVVAAIVAVSVNRLEKHGAVPASGGGPQGHLLYETYAGGYTSQLFTIDAAGGTSRDLGVDIDPGAVWFPDGSNILVTTTGGPEETALPVRPATIASDGSDRRILDGIEDRTLNVGCTAISPDVTRFACTGYTELDAGVYTVRAADGGGLRRLTDFGGVASDFSPEGDRIVLVSDDSIGTAGVSAFGTMYVVGVDGSGLERVTPEDAALTGPAAASWSPDGDWIVFIDADHRLQAMRPDGTDLHPVPMPPEAHITGLESGVSWSPDGHWIAVSAKAGGEENTDLYLVQVAGPHLDEITDYVQLTDTPDVAEFTPDWI
jgi:Tol biopolymer transport system component